MSMKKDGIQTRKRKAKMASKAATPTRDMNNTPDHNIMPSSYATSMPYTGNQSSGLLDLSVTRSDNQLGTYCHQYTTELYPRERGGEVRRCPASEIPDPERVNPAKSRA